MKKFLSIVLTLTCLLAAGCSTPAATESPAEQAPAATQIPVEMPTATQISTEASDPAPKNPEIILATTTSTRDSGLLDVLLPIFEEQTGYQVKMVAVGTGQALKMGEEGNADVLLVHAPSSEKEYMENGFGERRDLVMHNDFVLVGPADDPAGINGSPSAADALAKIASTSAIFVSRGDDSGTHKKELSLWKTANLEPAGNWYLETGQGMGDTLHIASEKIGYTLTDRATYLSQKKNLELDILFECDPSLLNIYHIIVVNPDKWPNINLDGANALADFMVSEDTQTLIGEFGVKEYGQPLFFPDAGKDEATLEK
jgi:tungstate transport system substrate-binding protein